MSKTQAIFDCDPYESRREALPGPCLLKELVFYQPLKDPLQRVLVRDIKESQDARSALGGHLAVCRRSHRLHLESTTCEKLRVCKLLILGGGDDFSDKLLVRNMLSAPVKGAPQQFVFAEAGKIHDLKATSTLAWTTGWTYLFNRDYFPFNNYQLTDDKLIRVLTDRYNLSALSIAQLYKERWTIEVTFEEARAHLGIGTQRQ